MKHPRIANSNRYHKYSKEINLSQTLSKIISDTKISKSLCQADILAFGHYLFAIKNNVQITFDEKESLFRNKNIKFIKKSLELLLQKMNVSKNISPEIVFDEKLVNVAIYRARCNYIVINKI